MPGVGGNYRNLNRRFSQISLIPQMRSQIHADFTDDADKIDDDVAFICEI